MGLIKDSLSYMSIEQRIRVLHPMLGSLEDDDTPREEEKEEEEEDAEI